MTYPKVLFSSKNTEWATPIDTFEALNSEFAFNLDACATSENTKCERFFDIEDDGLQQDWGTSHVFCNPPYGKHLPAWMEKCFQASRKGALVVALVPASTSTRWFHDWVLGKAELRFVKGRLTFEGAPYAAPFGSLIAIYRPFDTAARRVNLAA